MSRGELVPRKTGMILISGALAVVAACGSDKSEQAALSIDDAARYLIIAAGVGERDVCVSDQLTGLLWEQKTDSVGLRSWRNTYSWFNPTQSHREMDYRGTPNVGQCSDSDCDTWAYVAAVNAAVYCGFDDWRLPSRDELFSISDLRKAKNPPTIHMTTFPYTKSAEYWSIHDYSFQPDSAWAWSFRYGHDRVDWKNAAKYVRLVRGEAGGLTTVKE
jgi:hypothetical protein